MANVPPIIFDEIADDVIARAKSQALEYALISKPFTFNRMQKPMSEWSILQQGSLLNTFLCLFAESEVCSLTLIRVRLHFGSEITETSYSWIGNGTLKAFFFITHPPTMPSMTVPRLYQIALEVISGAHGITGMSHQ